MARLKEQYKAEVAPALMKQFGYKSVMQIPKIDKVVINVGCGEARENAKVLDNVVGDLGKITGQKAVITRARKSIANFKLREEMPIGAKVTLRGDKMWEFLDRLFNVALPRVRDFQGINPNAFDGRGNYALGIKEQLIFPEIEYDKIDKIRGMDIIIVTTAKTDEEGRALLQQVKNAKTGDTIVMTADTLIQFLKTRPVFESDEHEKAWLLRVAGNLCKNRLKYNSLRQTDELREELIAEQREDLSFIWDAVQALPVQYREVIHLFYREGYSTREISQILGRKEATIRSDLSRGRGKLKELLKEAYDFEV